MNNFSARFRYAVAGILVLLSSTAAAAPQNDVMLVLDNSGSMRKNDPTFLGRGAVESFINKLDTNSRAGVLIFDHSVTQAMPLTAIDADGKAALIKSLENINYRGQLTDSPAAVERAIYELKTNKRDGADQFIIFMTDGIVDNGNPAADVEKTKWLREELAVDAANNGIKVFAIAFTEHADFFLIQSLAKKTHGEYFRALSPADLAGVFDTVHAKLSEPSAPPPEPVDHHPAGHRADQREQPRDRDQVPDLHLAKACHDLRLRREQCPEHARPPVHQPQRDGADRQRQERPCAEHVQVWHMPAALGARRFQRTPLAWRSKFFDGKHRHQNHHELGHRDEDEHPAQPKQRRDHSAHDRPAQVAESRRHLPDRDRPPPRGRARGISHQHRRAGLVHCDPAARHELQHQELPIRADEEIARERADVEDRPQDHERASADIDAIGFSGR